MSRVFLLTVVSFILSFSFAVNAEAGKGMNPDISINVLGLFQRGSHFSDDRTAPPFNGLRLQEAEIQATSDVDPYLRASALFAIGQEDGTTEYAIEPEEVYLETISLPVVTMRVGKFKLAMGKHNLLHAHAYPFIDAPLISQQLLGEEGLNENAVSAAVLIPAKWFSELTLQGFSPGNEDSFGSTSSSEWGGLAHFKNLFDLSDDLTMEIGLSSALGKNAANKNTFLGGADLTFKWRPAQGGKYKALIWSTEYLKGDRNGFTDSVSGESTEDLDGVATWLQYQFAQRWWIQARYDYVGLNNSDALPFQTRGTALLGFFPSEFSGIRLQYDQVNTQGQDEADQIVSLQYNVSIGAHPAHAY